ncbi:hypothetical protein AVEN_91027-1, partial [Araneus ventricosus]
TRTRNVGSQGGSLSWHWNLEFCPQSCLSLHELPSSPSHSVESAPRGSKRSDGQLSTGVARRLPALWIWHDPAAGCKLHTTVRDHDGCPAIGSKSSLVPSRQPLQIQQTRHLFNTSWKTLADKTPLYAFNRRQPRPVPIGNSSTLHVDTSSAMAASQYQKPASLSLDDAISSV